jgi:hypothetical protein
MQNDLLMGTKYEDTELVAKITNCESEAASGFDPFFREIMQNFKRLSGYIFSEADLKKLTKEQRPKFVYNYLLPIVLQLMGNFVNNQSKIEAQPRTLGDVKMSNIMSDIIDYAHYTANDLFGEMNKAYANAIIGRVGWIVQDWRFDKDPEGMVDIQSYDPFRLMWDNVYTDRKLSKCKWIIERAWYTPEEICNIYALEKSDLYEEIMAKAKLFLGTDSQRTEKIITYMERVFGASFNYQGKRQGYDSVTAITGTTLYNNAQYYDTMKGLFKVIEFHERRSEKIKSIYDHYNNKWFDVSKAIDLSKDGKKFNNDKLQRIREVYGNPIVRDNVVNQLYVTAACPGMNIVLNESAYPIQNGNFKYTPIFCFDFGQDSLDWKSYIDHIIDPIMKLIRRENTIETYLLRATNGGYTAEESAFTSKTGADLKEGFLQNKIGGLKIVADGKLGAVRENTLPKLPAGLAEDSERSKQMIKEITGITGNSMGQAQTGRENARLFQQRVAQTDIMQSFIQDKAIMQLVTIGENTKDNLIKYLGKERAFRITNDETDPYWLQLNGDAIQKLFLDKNGDVTRQESVQGTLSAGKYDITLSKAPFGDAAKDKEFQATMIIAQELGKLNPAYIDPRIIIKSSRSRYKDEWIQRIQKVDKEAEQQAQQAGKVQEQAQNMDLQEKQGKIEKQQIENTENKNGLMVDELIKDAVGSAMGY